MEKRTVFISYASEDKARAKWLGMVFEANGMTCYISDHDEGDMEKATQQIDVCNSFVLLYSKSVKRIDRSSKETEYAFNAGKPIFPVVVDRCEFEGQYSYYLSRFDRFELYKSRAKNLKLLMGQIKNAEKPDGSVGKEIKIIKYDVDLLSEEDIDRIIAGEYKKRPIASLLSPLRRTYSKNPTVCFAMKCFTVILAVFFLLLTFNGCAEVTNAFIEFTLGEGFHAFEDIALILVILAGIYVLWSLSYFPSVLIAKMKIKNKMLIAIASVVTVWLLLAVVNVIGSM